MNDLTKKLPRLNVPSLAGLRYTLCTAIERASALLFTPIYTRLLSPEKFGVFTVYNSIMGILSVFVTLQIFGGAVYRGLSEFSDKDGFISSSIGLMSLSSFVCFAVYLIFSQTLGEFIKTDSALMPIMFLQMLLFGIRSLKISEAKYYYKKWLPIADSLVFAFLVPLVSIFLIIYSHHAEYARIFGLLISSAVFVPPLVYYTLKKAKLRLYSRPVWLFLLKYNLPVLPHYIASASIWQIGKIILGRVASAGEAAILALSVSIGFIPSLIFSGMQSAIIPWINRKLSNDTQARGKIYSLISVIFLPLCIFTALFLCFVPEITSIMAPKEYRALSDAVYPIALSVVLTFVINIFSAIISYYKKTFLVTVGSVSGAAFNLIFNLLFTFKLGFRFSAIIILPSTLITTLVYSVILKRALGHREMKISKIILPFVFLIFSAILLYFLKTSLVSRVLMSAVFIMLLIPNVRSAVELTKERSG